MAFLKTTVFKCLFTRNLDEFVVMLSPNRILLLQAVSKNIPILIDAERVREGLDDLLDLADYVVCSAKFPKASLIFLLKLYGTWDVNSQISLSKCGNIELL